MISNTNPKVPYQMERVSALINKLQEQLHDGVDANSLLITTQQLQTLLQEQVVSAKINRNGQAKVAVVMPAMVHVARQPEAATQAEQVKKEPASAKEEPAVKQEQREPVQETSNQGASDWLHTLMQEIPTLAHQKEIRELNDMMSQQEVAASLNDKLKQSAIEVAEILTREPVRDLKKAIGVNDRYVFVQELFRGDEVMYERSIKTINSFNILQEAEYWIERELKLKLAWDDSKDSVRHFCQLVRRRFTSK